MGKNLFNWAAMACAVSFGAATELSAAEIGKVAAVNRDMDGTPPSSSKRTLALGNDIVRDERIETSPIGSGQLMFLDQTTLTVSPNSDIVLDKYVYDDAAESGEIALTLTRGALRFIGGRISKKTDAVVRTPTVTIGIRGGLTLVVVSEDGTTQVIHLAGEYAEVTDASGRKVTLSRPNSAAEAVPGKPIEFLGIVGSEVLSEHFNKFEGSGDGGSDTAAEEQSGEEGERRVNSVAEINSGVQDGEERQPVSTSGEKEAPSPDRTTEVATSDEVILDFSFQEGDALFLTPDVPFVLPTGGSFFVPALGFVGFDTITFGSLIGTDAEGDTIRIPVAETSLDFTTTFDGRGTPDFFAQTRFENAGFVEFGPGDGASSTSLGELTGRGFSDLDNGFHLYSFVTDGSNEAVEEGVILFGTPTPGQGAEFAGDNGSNIAADANTVSVFRIEDDFTGGGGAGQPDALLLIGNGGEARFDHPDNTLPSGSGGRVAVADVRFDTDPETGEQFSTFTAFASEIQSTGTGGPRIGGTAFGTDTGGAGTFVVQTNLGTFEDQNGHTVFGPDADYLVLSSLHRPGGTGALTFNPGTEHQLGGPDTTLDPFLNLATRDPGADRVVNDTLPLASEPFARIGTLGTLDSVFATGFAECSTGNCGTDIANGGASGLYGLQSFNPAEGGTGIFSFSDGGQGPDNNALSFEFDLQATSGDSNVDGAVEGLEFTLSSAATFEPTSAYISDREFVLTTDRAQTIEGVTAAADVALASSGLAGGTGVLPGGVDADPEFLRWGWWSASLTVNENGGGAREDIVHLGTWIAGIQPNPSEIPFAGVATYSGLAVGVDANLTTGETARVGGDFALSYDFGDQTGAFDLNIAGHSLSNIPVDQIGGNGGPLSYAGFANQSGVDAAINGTFNSGAGNAIAATSGQFNIADSAQNRQVVGVFGGDLQNFSGGEGGGGGFPGEPFP